MMQLQSHDINIPCCQSPDESNIDLIEAQLERATWEIKHKRYIKGISTMLDYIGKQIEMPVTGAIVAKNIQDYLTKVCDKYIQSDVSEQLVTSLGTAIISVARKRTQDGCAADDLTTATTSVLKDVMKEFGHE